jgi:hypothetical protein
VESKSGQHPEPINHQPSPQQQNIFFRSLQNSKTIPFIGNYIKTPALSKEQQEYQQSQHSPLLIGCLLPEL